MDFENKNCRRFPLITAIYCGTKEILYMYHERRYVFLNHHLPAPAQNPYSTMQNGILRQDIEDESLGKRHQIPSNFWYISHNFWPFRGSEDLKHPASYTLLRILIASAALYCATKSWLSSHCSRGHHHHHPLGVCHHLGQHWNQFSICVHRPPCL